MAQKLTLNQPPAVKPGRAAKQPSKANRLPVAIAMLGLAAAAGVFSFSQVARVSPRRGDVAGIVQELRKEHPKGSPTLPSRVDPTRGTRLWSKKDGRG